MKDVGAGIEHLAWCALIALYSARQDLQVRSVAQENVFLTRWLAAAEKHRRFSRSLASDISWLLRVGREKGLSADLPGKLHYLWQAGSGHILEQNDLFRLQRALGNAQTGGWSYSVVSEKQLKKSVLTSGRPAAKVLMLCRYDLDQGFGEDGTQRHPLRALISGNVTELEEIFGPAGWCCSYEGGGGPFSILFSVSFERRTEL